MMMMSVFDNHIQIMKKVRRCFQRASIAGILLFFITRQYLASSRTSRNLKIAYLRTNIGDNPFYPKSYDNIVNATIINNTNNNITTPPIINTSTVFLKKEKKVKTTKAKMEYNHDDNNITTAIIPTTSTGFMKNRDNNHENETTKTKGGEGGRQRQEKEGSLHVVVSHCNTPIEWIWKDYLKNRSYKSVTIITKCDVPVHSKDLPPHFLHQSTSTNQIEKLAVLTQQQQPLVQVLSLPNVGRCDHSYAYWIAMVLGKEEESMKDDFQLLYSNRNNNNPFQSISIDPEDYVIFLKDNDNSYRVNIEDEITLQDMFDETKNRGMACASAVNEKHKYHNSWTNWAHRSVMWTFEMKRYEQKYSDDIKKNNSDTKNVAFRSSYRPIGEWIRYFSSYSNDSSNNSLPEFSERNRQVLSDEYMHMHSNIDEIHGYYYNFSRSLQIPAKNDTEWTKNYNKLDLVPMCFGGRFMTRWGQLSSEDAPIRNWSVITKALSRGDNIEEGHYMERWWADILSWSSYSSSMFLNSEEREHAMTTQNVRTNSNADDSGVFVNNEKDATTFYDEEMRHHHRSGEVLTQNEQKGLLRLKLKHMTAHSHSFFPYAGILILDAKKVRDQEESKANWATVRKAKKIQKQEEANQAARKQAENVRKQEETKANWKAIRQAAASARTIK